MSLIRGDLYVWGDGARWFLWSDASDGAVKESVWAEGREQPNGISVTEEQLVDLAHRVLERLPAHTEESGW